MIKVARPFPWKKIANYITWKRSCPLCGQEIRHPKPGRISSHLCRFFRKHKVPRSSFSIRLGRLNLMVGEEQTIREFREKTPKNLRQEFLFIAYLKPG